jgi:dTDP-4-amino-4,6-dideoxygalactose transaminase
MKFIKEFETLIGDYFNAPYAIAVDCCTHAIELCLRYIRPNEVGCPRHTYLSIPMTFEKLGLPYNFVNENWTGFYFIKGTNIVDAATYWKKDSYIKSTFMCISFQYKKHLKLGRGGMILLDDEYAFNQLSLMRYDGRENNLPWAEQDIHTIGYHYYMTPETAETGIARFHEVKNAEAKIWSYDDYPDISKMSVFRGKQERMG